MTTPRKRQWRKLSAEVRAGIENGGKVEAVAAKTVVIKPVAKPTEVVKEKPVTKTVAKTATKISSTKTATKTTTVKTATTKAKKTSN